MRRIVSLLISIATVCGLTYAGLGDDDRSADRGQTRIDKNARFAHAVGSHRDDPNDEEIFIDNFEDGAEGWTTRDITNPDTAFHISDFHGRFNARPEDDLLWWCGDTITDYQDVYIGYNNIWLQYLDTPVLDLSNAEAGLALTFDAYWLIEDPRRVPPPEPWDGWDGFLVMISEDGGESFNVIRPESPDYTAERISASERFWDIGPLPAWVYHSGEWGAEDEQNPTPDWVEATFDLSDFAIEDVVIRFMLITDRTVSAPFNAYLANSGVLLDNIVISDDEGNIFLFNNADDDPEPADLIARRGDGFGDFWELTDAEAHSGNFSMWNDDDHFNLRNALDSPPFVVPEEFNTYFQFWIRQDLPDYDGNNDNQLEDFFWVYASSDGGLTWNYLFYDWMRPETGQNGWAHYVPGTPIQGDPTLSLSEYAGEEVQLRWLFWTDSDDQGGNGDGLFIDDVEVLGSNRQPRDAGMENLFVPYPTTVGLRLRSLTAELHNFGTLDQNAIYANWGWRSDQEGQRWPLVPRPSVNSGEFQVLGLTDYTDLRDPGWTPRVPGLQTVWARTNLGAGTADNPDDDDQAPENDSTGIGAITVLPSGLYELGYDNRTIQFFHNFDPGTGAAVRYSPGDVGIGEYTVAAARFAFNGRQPETATFTLHVYGEGDEDTPGEELFSLDVDVPPDSTPPNRMTVPLYQVEDLRRLQGDFWLWAEIQREDNRPQIVGDELIRGVTHYFSFDGNNAVAYDADLAMWGWVTTNLEPTIDLSSSHELLDFGEVIERSDKTLALSFYGGGFEDVTVRAVTADDEAFTVFWPGETILSFGEAVTFDILFVPPDLNLHIAALTIDSDDETPPEVTLVASGVASVNEPPSNLPLRFGIESPYPNPFNSYSRVRFSVEKAGTVSVQVFDLAGRLAMTIADGFYQPGRHTAVLRADDLPAGVYLVRLQSADQTQVKKAALIR